MNYIQQALITKSNEFHGDIMPRDELMKIIGVAIGALQKLDQVKKTLFYGRDFHKTGAHIFSNSRSIASGWLVNERYLGEGNSEQVETAVFSEQRAIDVIHSILGKATEAGEQLELLEKTLITKTFDPVNFGEEMFDGQWYDAIGCSAIGMTFEQGQALNIAKLKKRFGDKFTAWYANNRDLVAERKVLIGTDAVHNESLSGYAKQTGQMTTIVAGMEFKDSDKLVNLLDISISPSELESAINALSFDTACNMPDFKMTEQIVNRVMLNRKAIEPRTASMMAPSELDKFRTDPIG